MNRRRRRAHRAAVTAAAPVRAELTVGDLIASGLWCRTCQLPSGLAFEVLANGVRSGTMTWCHDADSVLHDVEAPDAV